jgi:FAD binding domain
MTSTHIPPARLRHNLPDPGPLERDLRGCVDGEIRVGAGSWAACSTDGPNFRQVPIGVVVPRTIEAAAEAVAECREHGAPVLSLGGGTSLAGPPPRGRQARHARRGRGRVRPGRSRGDEAVAPVSRTPAVAVGALQAGYLVIRRDSRPLPGQGR